MTSTPGILLFGAAGQIGSELNAQLQSLWPIRALDRTEADLRDPRRLEAIITQTAPKLIINAAAYTAVDAAEADAETARQVNAEAPALMARVAGTVGAAMIHFSTDYVFDGTKHSPYTETDRPAPLNEYGRTKSAGDEAVERSGIPHLILRTSWVYAPRGRNFVRTVVSRAESGQRMRVVNDQTGTPTSASAIAATVVSIVQTLGLNPEAFRTRSGVYNLTAAGRTTWYGFAKEIVAQIGLEIDIEPITSAEFNAAAQRPPYSVLDTTKIRETFGIQMADWRDQLRDVLRGPAFSSR